MSASLMPPLSNTQRLQRLSSRGMILSRPSDATTSKRELSKRELNECEDPHDHSHWMAPPLAPKIMEPQRHSKGSDATQRLQRIECIEIADVVRHDDNKDYYVIHVYMQQEQSRIPTNQAAHQQLHHANHHNCSSSTNNKPHTHERKPDYVVERRFSEFEKLRHDIRAAVQHVHPHYCNFCDGFLFMLLFTPAQPAKLAKTLLRSTGVRSKMLDKFIHRLMGEFLLLRPRCRYSCYATHNLPVILQEFLMGDSQPQELDPTSSPLATATL